MAVSACGRTFHAPKTATELAALLGANPGATILAGGTDIGLWVTKQHRELDKIVYTGNVRELQNICERASVLTPDDRIKASLVGPWLGGAPGAAAPVRRPAAMIEAAPSEGGDVDCPGIICDGNLTLQDVEREAIVATLGRHGGHRQRSAAALGIGIRTLGLKLKKWKEQQVVPPSL